MIRTYEKWLKYYDNATKEQVIEDMMLDINSIKEKNKEIEKLKELVIALWHNDNARFLNKEQIDLLNNIVFGNDEEDLGSDKE